jgi:hypothetical protein
MMDHKPQQNPSASVCVYFSPDRRHRHHGFCVVAPPVHRRDGYAIVPAGCHCRLFEPRTAGDSVPETQAGTQTTSPALLEHDRPGFLLRSGITCLP